MKYSRLPVGQFRAPPRSVSFFRDNARTGSYGSAKKRRRRGASVTPRYGKIFVVCPGGIVTGGPEGLHQLVHELRGFGADAHIAYFPFDRPFATLAAYSDYDVAPASIEDQPGNLVVVPEVLAELSGYYHRAATAIWWLSVDNFFNTAGRKPTLGAHVRALMYRIGLRDTPAHQPTLASIRNKLHFAQSAYAMNFLQARRMTASDLGDYLNPVFANEADGEPRDKTILYNKAKPSKALDDLRRAFPDLAWVPLAGMERGAVRAACRRAMLYVDFGAHPGRDRLPREAAISGACVITGRRGSAANDEDVAIPAAFKLDETAADFTTAFRACVDQVMGDFTATQDRFSDYRATIADDRRRFQADVREVFFG